jgi:hypothetical protein
MNELDDKGQIDHDLWCIVGTIIRASRAAAGGGKSEGQFADVGAWFKTLGFWVTVRTVSVP